MSDEQKSRRSLLSKIVIVPASIKAVLQTAVILLVFFGLLVVLSTYHFANQAGITLSYPDPFLVFIALIPFIIWLIVSGRIKQVSAGPVEVQLRDEAQRPIFPELAKMSPPLEAPTILPKGSLEVESLRTLVMEKRPTILSFEMWRENHYDGNAVHMYVKVLESESEFRFTLFTDRHGKFKGLMKANDFKWKFLRDVPDRNLVRNLENGSILEIPEVITNYVGQGSTIRETLELMEDTHTDVMPVVDGEGKFLGVVTQDGIVRKIMARLLST